MDRESEAMRDETEKSRRSLGGFLALLVFMTLLLTSGPTSAYSSSGSFTVATANKTWTKGQLKGHVSWSGCADTARRLEAEFHPTPIETTCQWQPAVIVQPTLPSYPCRFAWNPNDPNIKPVWAGAIRSIDGVASFDEDDAEILPGVVGQRTCLIVLQKIEIHYCAGSTCTDIESFADSKVLDEAFLQVMQSIPRSKARQIARKKLNRRFGETWRRGSSKRVSCVSRETEYLCRASWKYRNVPKRAVVRVPRFA